MNTIPEYVKTATKAVLKEHDKVKAVKTLRTLISALNTQFDGVDYLSPFHVSKLNMPSLKWCVDYVDYYIANMD